MCFSLKAVEGARAPETERARLERAIERLSGRQWCEDAQIALDAARRHLATLPPDRRYRVHQQGRRGYPDFYDVASNEAARTEAISLLECGATSVRIEPL